MVVLRFRVLSPLYIGMQYFVFSWCGRLYIGMKYFGLQNSVNKTAVLYLFPFSREEGRGG